MKKNFRLHFRLHFCLHNQQFVSCPFTPFLFPIIVQKLEIATDGARFIFFVSQGNHKRDGNRSQCIRRVPGHRHPAGGQVFRPLMILLPLPLFGALDSYF